MATETKFTPGPYACDGRIGTIHTENGRLLAEVYCPTKCGTATEWAATTELLAAAPDLYAALAGCAQVLRESAKQFRSLEDHPGHAGIADNFATLAEAALAKARGEVV